MKIFSNKFELTQPIERQIYVAPNSIYAIGVKVTKNGEATDGTLSVFVGSSALTPMAAKVDGYTLYQITSTAEPSVVVYDVVYTKNNLVQHFKLIGNTTNSTVFDIDQQGGAMDLPIASEGVLGGVKVGETLDITADGVLNVNVDEVALKDDIPVVPTKTSELENDSNFVQKNDDGSLTIDSFNATNITVTGGAIQAGDATVIIDPQNFLTKDGAVAIPVAVSELTNDSGFVSQSDVESTAQTVA